MITFTETILQLRMQAHLSHLATSWRSYEDGVRFALYPEGPQTFPCNSYGFELKLDKLKLGFWTIKGLEAIAAKYAVWEIGFMDRWCFWASRSDRQKRVLIWQARRLKEPWCPDCGQYIRDYEPSLEEE